MKRIVILIIAILSFSFQEIAAQDRIDPTAPGKNAGGVGYSKNEIVVKFSRSTVEALDSTGIQSGITGIADIDQLGRKHKAVSVIPVFPNAKPRKYKGAEVDLATWYSIKFPDEVDIQTVLEEYRASPSVVSAEPVPFVTVDGAPNDPSFPTQWFLNQSNDSDAHSIEAWNFQTGSQSVIVAVLDTGVRYYHKDLGGSSASYTNKNSANGNMWINWAEKNGIPGVDDDGNGRVDDWIGWDFADAPYSTNPCASGEDCSTPDSDPSDFNGHGTHCAGIIGAITNNGSGLAGIAGGWGNGAPQSTANGIKVMALRIGYHDTAGNGIISLAWAAQALQYAADKGAKIASCSWGSSAYPPLVDAINYFYSHGGLVFKSAGNSNYDLSITPDYMCGRSDIVCVAATDQNDCKASFTYGGSNYGVNVDLSAPGKNIYSTYHDYTNPSADEYESLSGTSMATPLAAGVAALIWSENPDWSAEEVRQKLLYSTDYINNLACNSSYSGKLGSGRVNAYKAVLSGYPIGVFRPGSAYWYLDLNGNGQWDGCGTEGCFPFGSAGDRPVCGDWNNDDGVMLIGVFRPSTGWWYLDTNGDRKIDCAVDRCTFFGQAGDIPVTGDWNGDGSTQIGVFRPSTGYWYLDLNGNGQFDSCGTDACIYYGTAGDLPVTGDWNGDSVTEIGVFRPSTGRWYLDLNGDRAWSGCGTDGCYYYGTNGDLPVTGKWTGDNITKIGVFRPSTVRWYLDLNGDRVWSGCGTDACYGPFGVNGDVPISLRW